MKMFLSHRGRMETSPKKSWVWEQARRKLLLGTMVQLKVEEL